jgi:hypothetical protein
LEKQQQQVQQVQQVQRQDLQVSAAFDRLGPMYSVGLGLYVQQTQVPPYPRAF